MDTRGHEYGNAKKSFIAVSAKRYLGCKIEVPRNGDWRTRDGGPGPGDSVLALCASMHGRPLPPILWRTMDDCNLGLQTKETFLATFAMGEALTNWKDLCT